MERQGRQFSDAAETAPVRDPLLHPRSRRYLIEVGQTTDPEGDWVTRSMAVGSSGRESE